MRFLRLFRLVVFASTCSVSAALADSIVTDWNTATLDAVRATRFGPAQTARALAIVHTCIFDAWAAYDQDANGTQYYGTLRRPILERTHVNKETAISYAAYRALVDLFPSQRAAFDARMADLELDPADTSTDITTPVGIGNVVSTAVLADRHYDGANQLGDLHAGAYTDYTGYAPVNTPTAINDPNRWQPLTFSNPNGGFSTPGYLVPHWGNVKPFALEHAAQFRPLPPKRYPDPGYITQAEKIISMTANLNDRRKAIAEYWSDGPASETPPGHWQLLAQFVSLRDGFELGEDAKLFFALGNAMLDASIATWEAKRFYDSERPITAIRFLNAGKILLTWGGTRDNPATVAGEEWKPYQLASFVTPPFAEHTSGHSCFSAAAAFILRAFTGSDRFEHSAIVPAGSSRIQPGVVPATDIVLTWRTFTEAANEAGLSRRYGGIHFHTGDIAGRQLGRQVGKVVWKKARKAFNGNTLKGGD